MIEPLEQEGGVVLPVRAQPGARREAILDERDGMLRIAVTAPPEDGKANRAIERLLARELGVAKSRVRVVAGATHRHKKLWIEGWTIDAARGWLAERGL